MHNRFKFALLLPLFLFSVNVHSQKMSNKKLGKILTEVTDSISGTDGYWQASYKEMILIVITDENHNRMRMITPIAYVKDLDEENITKALEANFHSALDVKYAISDSLMWTVFIHPLKELSEDQIKDGISQLFYSAVTFGGSYSSTDLVFPAKKED